MRANPAGAPIPLVGWFFFAHATAGLLLVLADVVGVGQWAPFTAQTGEPMAIAITCVALLLLGLLLTLVSSRRETEVARPTAAWRFLGSLRLTVLLLASSTLLVFLATLDQTRYGVYFIQHHYFGHVLTLWTYPEMWPGAQALAWLQVPLPGGYFLGPLLVINLCCAHFTYFRPSWRKAGIVMIHGGVIVLLLGQLVTQMRQREYFLWLAEGESSAYVESFHHDELVVVETTDPDRDRVFAWDYHPGRQTVELTDPALPFKLRLREATRHAGILSLPGAEPLPPGSATQGIAAAERLIHRGARPSFANNERDIATALVDVVTSDGVLGTWMVSNIFRERPPTPRTFPRQAFTYEGRTFEVSLRYRRAYLPASVELVDFRHDRYPGTEIPFNFSSLVRLHEADAALPREALIYMNNPLRFGGLTFYQASFAPGDLMSMFQVVSNPARIVPYIASGLISVGLVVQFLLSLVRHLSRPRIAPPTAANTIAA